MRVKVGQVVDTDKDVNLSDLKPVDRIIAAAMNAYKSTAIYKRRFSESEERKAELNRKRREALTDAILGTAFKYLERSGALPDGSNCDSVLVSVSPKYTKYLYDILESHSLDAFQVKLVPPSKDLSKFIEAPYLLHISKRSDI